MFNFLLFTHFLFLFYSDHGDVNGDHNLWRKGFAYESSAHVPGFIVWPKSAEPVSIQRGSSTDLVTEIRDVFPTMLDISGDPIPPNGQIVNGSSWACLVKKDPTGSTCGPSNGPWRSYVDLEHSTVFNETIHWNALTDGKIKYVFRAFLNDEQLFNLTADPYEYVNLATDNAYTDVLTLWRNRLVQQFETEGRGPN